MRYALLVTLAVSPAALAQQPSEAFAPAGGGFTVHFPGKPKSQTSTTKTAIGDLKVLTATYATADGSVYLVSTTDFPPAAVKPDGHKALLDGVREGLKGGDGKLVSEKDVRVGAEKLAGREVVIDKGKQQTRFRVVMKDNRLYQVAAVGTGPFVTGREATEFLDSFELAK